MRTPGPDRQAIAEGILAQAGDAIVFADREGVIARSNRSSEALFGFPADEALGRSLLKCGARMLTSQSREESAMSSPNPTSRIGAKSLTWRMLN